MVAGFDADGRITASAKFPTPKDQTEYLKTLQSTVAEVAGNETIDVISIAMPGIIKDGVALWCNNLKWENFRAKEALEVAFPGVRILIENDANLAGLSETRGLEVTPVSSLYVTVSTGIGTGITTNGHIDPGLRHSEGGRILVEYNGESREWESFASGGAIYRTYDQYARDITDPKIWSDIAHRISRGFLAVIPLIQPDIIIIGGSMGTYFDSYGKELAEILAKDLPHHIPCPPIIAARHPEEAVIYGCYYYAIDELSAIEAEA